MMIYDFSLFTTSDLEDILWEDETSSKLRTSIIKELLSRGISMNRILNLLDLLQEGKGYDKSRTSRNQCKQMV